MARVCEYFFAPQSPWAYLGHMRFIALAKRPSQRQPYWLVELKR